MVPSHPKTLKGSSRTIEMNYGKIAVLITDWLHRWAELKLHQLLAIVIAYRWRSLIAKKFELVNSNWGSTLSHICLRPPNLAR